MSKRDYPERPIVGVGAVIVAAGRAVLVRRGGEPLAGEWSVPGGALELGETLRAGAEREALEETGLVVEAGEVLEVFDSITRDAAGREQYHFVLIDFLCRVRGGELQAGGDALEARWVTAEEMDALGVRATIRDVVRQGLSAFQETSYEKNPRGP